MRHLIIGDIHGCFDELQALLDKSGLSCDDEIIALGDIVDRGPASPKVVEFFRERNDARTIQGNHERKHVRSFRGEIRPALSQQITREQLGEDSYREAFEFFDELPRYIELDEAILVHGYFEPGISLSDQKEAVIVGTMTGEKIVSRKTGPDWFKLYDGSKPLIVGHKDYLKNGQPLIFDDRVFGIDTNCCRGEDLPA